MTPNDEQYTGTLISDLMTLVNIDRWNQQPERSNTLSKPAASSSQTTTTILPRSRGERGTGTTITIDLTDYPDLLTQIKAAAKTDDREPSKWLRRRLVQLGTILFHEAQKAREEGK